MLKPKLILWPPDAKKVTHWKRPWCWKVWRQEEKGMTENVMVGWHHQLNGREFEQAPGAGDGQGSLACCSPWGPKEVDTTEQLNWTDTHTHTHTHMYFYRPHYAACKILVPQSGFEPNLLAGQHGVLTTGLLGNSCSIVLCVCVNCISIKKETKFFCSYVRIN